MQFFAPTTRMSERRVRSRSGWTMSRANEETRDSLLSFHIDDCARVEFLPAVFPSAMHHLNDRYNDDEAYTSQPLAAIVRDVPGSIPYTYFVNLLNPASPLPSQLPPGQRVVESAYYFGPFGSLNITARKTAGYQGTLTHRGGSLVFGYDYQRQSGNIGGLDAARDNHGIFAEAQQNIGNRLFLAGGIRYEHSSTFGSIGSGRGGVSLLLFGEHGALTSTTLRLSGGRGTTEPSLYENFIQSPFAQGNPNLKPETANSYEAAISQDWWGRRVRTEVALFRSSFNDLIAFVGTSWLECQRELGSGSGKLRASPTGALGTVSALPISALYPRHKLDFAAIVQHGHRR